MLITIMVPSLCLGRSRFFSGFSHFSLCWHPSLVLRGFISSHPLIWLRVEDIYLLKNGKMLKVSLIFLSTTLHMKHVKSLGQNQYFKHKAWQTIFGFLSSIASPVSHTSFHINFLNINCLFWFSCAFQIL